MTTDDERAIRLQGRLNQKERENTVLRSRVYRLEMALRKLVTACEQENGDDEALAEARAELDRNPDNG